MPELGTGNNDNKEYEIEAILVVWKGYLKEENTWEPLSAIKHLKKLINCFHKKHPKKPRATFPLINSALPIVRPIIKQTKSTTKR